MAIPIIEELLESLRSAHMHYTTINAPRGVKILEDIMECFNKSIGDGTHITKFREGHGHQPCGLTSILRCVACVLFWVHLFVTCYCVYFQRSYNVPNLERVRVNLLQQRVDTTLLDPRNMSDLNCIPPDQHAQGWALLRSMVNVGIDEVKNSDASNDVNDSIEDVNGFLVTTLAAATVNSLDLSSA